MWFKIRSEENTKWLVVHIFTLDLYTLDSYFYITDELCSAKHSS